MNESLQPEACYTEMNKSGCKAGLHQLPLCGTVFHQSLVVHCYEPTLRISVSLTSKPVVRPSLMNYQRFVLWLAPRRVQAILGTLFVSCELSTAHVTCLMTADLADTSLLMI